MAESRADVGLGIQAAALALGLDFVPLARERYDLIIPEETWHQEAIGALMNLIQDPGFRQTLETLGGYGTNGIGTVTWLN